MSSAKSATGERIHYKLWFPCECSAENRWPQSVLFPNMQVNLIMCVLSVQGALAGWIRVRVRVKGKGEWIHSKLWFPCECGAGNRMAKVFFSEHASQSHTVRVLSVQGALAGWIRFRFRVRVRVRVRLELPRSQRK